MASDKFRLSLVALEKSSRIKPGPCGHVASGSRNGGGNSGFQAFNLAVQFGAKRIALVGFDMRCDLGVHWHGRHPGHMNNPRESNFQKWRAGFSESAPIAASLGVTVANCSPVSTLTAFPIMSLEEALAC